MTKTLINYRRIDRSIDINNKQIAALQRKHHLQTAAQIKSQIAPSLLDKIEPHLESMDLFLKEVHAYIANDQDVILTVHLMGSHQESIAKITNPLLLEQRLNELLMDHSDPGFITPVVLMPLTENTFKIRISRR